MYYVVKQFEDYKLYVLWLSFELLINPSILHCKHGLRSSSFMCFLDIWGKKQLCYGIFYLFSISDIYVCSKFLSISCLPMFLLIWRLGFSSAIRYSNSFPLFPYFFPFPTCGGPCVLGVSIPLFLSLTRQI